MAFRIAGAIILVGVTILVIIGIAISKLIVNISNKTLAIKWGLVLIVLIILLALFVSLIFC